MTLVVLDTSVILPAVLSPTGRRRSLLVLLAYGRLGAYAQMGEDEALAFERELEAPGSRAGARSVYELLQEAARRKARLGERLPALAPDELYMAGSRPLLDEYEKKLRERGPSIVPDSPASLEAGAPQCVLARLDRLLRDRGLRAWP